MAQHTAILESYVKSVYDEPHQKEHFLASGADFTVVQRGGVES